MPPHWRGVEKQIDKNPKLAQVWGLRGKIYLAQQDFTHAEADLLKAIDLDPNLEPAYLLLAQLYVASNRQEEAIAKLSAFVEKNKTVPALMQLGYDPGAAEEFCCSSRRLRETTLRRAKFAPGSQ